MKTHFLYSVLFIIILCCAATPIFADESDYWVELLYETNSISAIDFERLKKQIIEIRRMLVSSVTTLKNKTT